jgi:hypothetical protein
MARRKPYSERGIRRLKCWRLGCENRAFQQWQICADGNVYRPVCWECDVEMNGLVLAFMGDPEAYTKMKRYAERGGTDDR